MRCKEKSSHRSSCHCTAEKHIQLGTMRLRVQSLTSLTRLRIPHCHELWCGSQMRLRSGIAVAVAQASCCSSNQTPSLGTSTCCECGPKKQKKKKSHTKHHIQLPKKVCFKTKYYIVLSLPKETIFISQVFCLFFVFLGPHLRHMEVPRLGIESELQPLAYARATATLNPRGICDPHHSSWQCQIFNPLSEARD